MGRSESDVTEARKLRLCTNRARRESKYTVIYGLRMRNVYCTFINFDLQCMHSDSIDWAQSLAEKHNESTAKPAGAKQDGSCSVRPLSGTKIAKCLCE